MRTARLSREYFFFTRATTRFFESNRSRKWHDVIAENPDRLFPTSPAFLHPSETIEKPRKKATRRERVPRWVINSKPQNGECGWDVFPGDMENREAGARAVVTFQRELVYSKAVINCLASRSKIETRRVSSMRIAVFSHRALVRNRITRTFRDAIDRRLYLEVKFRTL